MTQAQKPHFDTRAMALDVGDRTVGVALSDPMRMTAQPKETLRYPGEHEWGKIHSKLVRIICEEKVGDVVIGLPLNMNGSEGPQADKVRRFTDGLEKLATQKATHPVNIIFWDERLSTSGAARELIAADVSRAKRREVIDTMAAVFILQGYLSATVRRLDDEDYS